MRAATGVHAADQYKFCTRLARGLASGPLCVGYRVHMTCFVLFAFDIERRDGAANITTDL